VMKKISQVIKKITQAIKIPFPAAATCSAISGIRSQLINF
jgi:hypothetical protein